MVKLRGVFGYVSIIFIFFFLVFSKEAAQSALSGIKLCAQVLVPTLFPMMVLSGLCVRSRVLTKLGRMGNKIFSPAFGIGGKYIISFFIGIIGSAPTGAMAVKSLSDNGETADETASALLLSSTVSFGFIYSVVGIHYLDDARRGIALFLFQILSVMITAAVLRPKKRPSSKTDPFSIKPEKTAVAVASSIRDAVTNILSVCGSVVFFSALSGIFLSLPIGDKFKLFLCPFFEVSSGLEYISVRFPPDITFILASSAVGWSGLSMIFQSIAVAGDSIPTYKYILGRAVSALICPVLALIAINLGII